MIEKTYNASELEGRIYASWEAAGAFQAGRPERCNAAPYSIVIPPPNVTGSLHMGHALNNTLQDVLVRFERMRGRDVLWQPGTDHAGIATQMVVERQLMERQEPSRRAMGREAFIKRVWEWKEESGGAITRQLKRLGASCDWSRERFTMDEGLSRAVLKVFVDLHKAGLIYKDKRLVHWDPKLGTALSDLEVQQVEVKGHLWYFKYPVEGLENTFITVATTRPETMLGDVAIAVHPDDARYKHLVGGHAFVPLVGRRIPIIADEYSDPEKGTGAVKVTPAHDFNDFEVGRRRGLRMISVFDTEGKILLRPNLEFTRGVDWNPDIDITIQQLNGVDRFQARKWIIARMEQKGLLEKVEPHTHTVPHGDRSGVVLEPFLTDQWYVNAKKMAQSAMEAVRQGDTVFVPKQWETTYFNWMENVQPWCISRQIWWGHRIPAWYGPAVPSGLQESVKKVLAVSGHWSSSHACFVAIDESEAIHNAQIEYGTDVKIVETEYESFMLRQQSEGQTIGIWRDEDVLDTWFSSALWPFSTLGWPDDTPELKRYYPTNVLVTGFDIIFFWVARMMMMGLHFMEEVPFRDVYIHALVRDEKGAKMSKSKGNVIDPLALIDDYGADALRFTLVAMAAQGRDIKLSRQRVEGYRNFATKLWNAARFAEMNGCVTVPSFDPLSVKETLNGWIRHETANAAGVITAALKAYKFNEAAAMAYLFVWNIYCDWYLELAKPVLLGEESPAKDETRATVAWGRDQILKMLHPFMPFITEELWDVTEKRSQLLALTDWPKLSTDFDDARSFSDAGAEAEVGWLIELITAIRSLRAEMKITAEIPLVLVRAGEYTREHAQNWAEFIKQLARVSQISFSDTVPQGSVQLVVRGELAALPLQGVIDLAAERGRLEKEMAKVASDMARIDAKLGNADFLRRAPEEVVEGEREKREEAESRRARILEALERLKGAA